MLSKQRTKNLTYTALLRKTNSYQLLANVMVMRLIDVRIIYTEVSQMCCSSSVAATSPLSSCSRIQQQNSASVRIKMLNITHWGLWTACSRSRRVATLRVFPRTQRPGIRWNIARLNSRINYCIFVLLLIGPTQNVVVIRLDATLPPNIGFTLRGNLAVFTRSAITPPKVNRYAWNLDQSEYIVGGQSWQILGAIRAVATIWQAGDFFVVH